MEEKDIINLWKAHEAKLEHSLAVNLQVLKEIKSHKAQAALDSLKRLKTRGIVALGFYLFLLGLILSYAVKHYTHEADYFIVSMSAIFLINVRALYDYIKHLVWANGINYEGSVTDIQQQLSRLQVSILKHSRIMCLQFPFWTTFYLSNKWFPDTVGWGYIAFQLTLTGSFLYCSIWLVKNLRMENIDNKWFSYMIAGSGGKSVGKAMEFFKEIEAYKTENAGGI
jgi:hypothetical protein